MAPRLTATYNAIMNAHASPLFSAAAQAGTSRAPESRTASSRRSAAPILSREIRLASRPSRAPLLADNFALTTVSLPATPEGHVLVRNRYLSIDPCVFCRSRGGRSHLPAFEVGQPLEGGAVGTVVESRSKAFEPGDIVISNYGWREWFVAPDAELRNTSPRRRSLSVYLSMLGLQSVCPWACSYLVQFRPDQVLLVQGAARLQGSIANLLARLRGCHIVGSAGSREMIAFLRDTCGFDVALDDRPGAFFDNLEHAHAAHAVADDPSLEAAMGVCMASSFIAKVTPGAECNSHDMPLPIFFLSQTEGSGTGISPHTRQPARGLS